MKKSCLKSGFTLIELLVVVLIIGILAAIALPQYQKAVLKARVTEAIAVGSTLEKTIDLYVLEHGLPTDMVLFTGTNKVDSDIKIGITDDGTGTSSSKDFGYYAHCNGTSYEFPECGVSMEYRHAALYLGAHKGVNDTTWTHSCETCAGGIYEDICQSLYDKGWQESDDNC